ncbi:MAG: multiheme c-type cytochrome [Thermodesulfobacteriota bacterium]
MAKRHYLFLSFFFMFTLAGVPRLTCSSDEGESGKIKSPFFPSLINTHTGKPVKSSEFTSPDVCGGCHTEIYRQWKGSMHSHAYVDPVFQALWKMGSKETEGLTDKLCGGCHTGIGIVSEELVMKDGEFQVSDIAKKGVQCDLCHTIVKSTFLETPTHEPQNASIVLEPGEVKRGPYKDSNSPFHETAYSELHTKSEFCANCHHVFHPVTNFHIERTYDEWKYSIYAQKGIQCQDCHMMPVEQAIETAKTLKKQKNPGKACTTGPERDQVYTHEFVGANFTVTSLLGSPQHAEMAKKRLQSAAELTVNLPETAEKGNIVTVGVKVTNVGAGHNLPTSLTEVRQMWIEFLVTDAKGTTIYQSGKLDKEGNIDPQAKIFHAKSVNEAGTHTYKPWEMTRFEYNYTIPPKGSATTGYTFLVPDKVKGPLTVKAILRYRSYPQSLADLLLGKGTVTLPIVDMTQKEVKLIVKK